MANNIIQIKFDNNNIYDIRPYVECRTAAGTRAKTLDYPGFNIVTGSTIVVKFTNGNTYTGNNDIQLSINSNVINTNCNKSLNSGEILEFIYDGAIWRVLDGGAFASEDEIKGLFNK